MQRARPDVAGPRALGLGYPQNARRFEVLHDRLEVAAAAPRSHDLLHARVVRDRRAGRIVVAIAECRVEQGTLRGRPLHEEPGRFLVLGRLVDPQRPGKQARVCLAARAGRDQRIADLAGDLRLLGVFVTGGEEVRIDDHARLTGREGLHRVIPLHIGPVRRAALADHANPGFRVFHRARIVQRGAQFGVELVPLTVGVGLETAAVAGADGRRARRAAGHDTRDSGVLLHQSRRLDHLFKGRWHLDLILVEYVLAVRDDVTLLEHRNGVDRSLAHAAANLAIPAVGGDQRRIEVLEVVPAPIGQLRIVEEAVQRQDPVRGHELPVPHRARHDDREFAALLRQIGRELREVFRLGQDKILDADARQAPELRDERQQRFGERVLVQADREGLARGLPPVDLGLAVT